MKIFTLFKIRILFLPFLINAFPTPEGIISNEFEHEKANLDNVDSQSRAISNLSSSLIETMTTDVSNSSDEQIPPKKGLTLLITFCVIAFFCVLANVRAFCIVFLTSKRKSRLANILVAHLSFVIIVFTFLGYTYISEKSDVLNLSAPGVCNVITFLRNVFYNVLSVNTVAIIWMRVKDNAVILRKSAAYRVIGVTWTITLVCNLPSIWMVEYVTSSETQIGECVEKKLLDSFAATMTYNLVYLLFFNLLVSLYLFRAAIKIKSVLNYLQTFKLTHSKTMLGRTKQARLVYFQTILFIVNWLPLGFGTFVYQMFNTTDWKDTYVNYLTPLVFFYSNVIIFSPLSYVYLIEKMSIAEIIAPCLRSKCRHGAVSPERRPNPKRKPKSNIECQNKSATAPTGNGITNKIPDQSFLTSEMSRISTAGITKFSGSENNSMANIRPLPLYYFAQCSSTAARTTRATYYPMKKVTVEVHSVPNHPNTEDDMKSPKHVKETLV